MLIKIFKGVLTIWKLTSKEVDIFYIYINSHNIPIEYLTLLDKEELELYHRYKVHFKKTEFLVGRVLTKTVLSKYLETRPEDVYFTKNKYGKLYLKEHLRYKMSRLIQFNISHSQNMIVCAVTLDHEIGVDVEKINGPIFDIAERFFTPREKEYISNCEPAERERTAYKIWTLKEAFAKAKGLGLLIPLNSFDVTLLNKEEEVFLQCIELKPDYYISIAIDSHIQHDFQTKITEVKNLSQLINPFDDVDYQSKSL